MEYSNELVLWLGYSVGCLFVGLSAGILIVTCCFSYVAVQETYGRKFKAARTAKAYYSWTRFNRRYNKRLYSRIEESRAMDPKRREALNRKFGAAASNALRQPMSSKAAKTARGSALGSR